MTDHSNLLTPNGAAFIAAFNALGIPGQLETDARVRLLGEQPIGVEVVIQTTVLYRTNIAVYDGPNRYRVEPKAWEWQGILPLHHLDRLTNMEAAGRAYDMYEQGRAAVARIVLGDPGPHVALAAANTAGAKRYAGG